MLIGVRTALTLADMQRLRDWVWELGEASRHTHSSCHPENGSYTDRFRKRWDLKEAQSQTELADTVHACLLSTRLDAMECACEQEEEALRVLYTVAVYLGSLKTSDLPHEASLAPCWCCACIPR